MKQPFVLCILDGWGVRPEISHNGIFDASTPNYDRFLKTYPSTTLEASEGFVGLPDHQMGNSEVGHMNIGAGRLVMQDLPMLDSAFLAGSFFQEPLYQNLLTHDTIHLFGLISDGGIHSHINHIIALGKDLLKQGKKVWIHGFLDGRDTPPKSALGYVQQILDEELEFATLGGRYYGMDRDKRWDRILLAYNAIMANGPIMTSPTHMIEECYKQGITDEFIPPHVSSHYHGLSSGDAVVMVNFRSDRVRQILTALVDPHFSEFKTNHPAISVFGIMEYSNLLNPLVQTFYPPKKITNSLGEWISNLSLKQLRLAETEKYAHVTFFFNGGVEKPFDGEDRILVPSPKVATYDLSPEMSADAVCFELCKAIESREYDLIVVNFANADMVGHTGVEPAIVAAIQKLDECLGEIEASLLKVEGVMLLTSDHGNAEETFDEKNHQPHTAHTLNPVPFVIINPQEKIELKEGGKLSDIAPTCLKLMNLAIPKEMTGKVLI